MLTAKQKRFCQEYMIDSNATQAAKRAGYSEDTAYSIGSENLKKPEIQVYIKELQDKIQEDTGVTAQYVLLGLKSVAERCLIGKAAMEWDYEKKAFLPKTDEQGNIVYEFDSNGANRAFELLGRTIGIFEKDNGQKQTKSNVKVILGKRAG